MHGNSLDYPGVNYGYILSDKTTGEVVKFGESINPANRYTKKFLNGQKEHIDMQIKISSPKHYESMYGSSNLVRAYLDQIEKRVGEAITSEVICILRISLLIAQPEELAQGKFLEYEQFDWRCGYVAVGVNGNFERYHLGDDLVKICELSSMLQAAFMRISKKKKAKFDCKLASEIVIHITHTFEETFHGNKETVLPPPCLDKK